MRDKHYDYCATLYGGEAIMEAVRFRDGFVGDCYQMHHRGTLVIALDALLQRIKTALGEMFPAETVRVVVLDSDTSLIKAPGQFLVRINQMNHTEVAPWTEAKRDLSIVTCGSPEMMRRFHDAVLTHIPPSDTPVAAWHYLVRGDLRSANVFLNRPEPLRREFYPWLNESPDAYIQRYLDHDASILLLRGEPGTGKTSFIRNLIWQSRRNAMLTYEEELFRSDELFVTFLTESTADIMVMEDADVLLTSREKDHNTAMNKFLNVADGLIRFPHKKLVISANVVDEGRVDPALLRPGRCFDAPLFRRLSYDESCAAAQAADICRPEVRRDYTLAEMFACGETGRLDRQPPKRHVAFIGQS